MSYELDELYEALSIHKVARVEKIRMEHVARMLDNNPVNRWQQIRLDQDGEEHNMGRGQDGSTR